tara:strand:- start:1580 stop:2125 length:546 start_codon:yes stop_codon:yes gene_type:complete
MKRIPLPSLLDLRAQLTYDPETGMLQYRSMMPYRRRSADQAGFIQTSHDGSSYRVVTVDQLVGPGKRIFAHRVAWKLMTYEDPPAQIDHIDGNGLNNAWRNLRSGEGCVNARNRRMSSRNRSGFNGVHRDKRGNRWVATFRSEGRTITLGRFTDKREAAEVARAARLEAGYSERHGLPVDP